MLVARYLIFILSISLVLQPLQTFSYEKLLNKGDVAEVMQQILAQHVDHKKITDDVLQTSYGIYLDQFDEDRVYLLHNEVRDQLSELRMKGKHKTSLNEFEAFEEYEVLDQLIAQSILRAQKIRAQIREKIKFKPLSPHMKDVQTGDRQFAWSEQELRERIHEDMQRYLDYQVKKYGASSVQKSMDRYLNIYENILREREDSYLYKGNNGQNLSDEMKENLFVVHVLKSLTRSLDAHSRFFDDEEAFDMRVRLEKGFYGVGVALKETDNGVIIGDIYEGGAADKNGNITINDRLVKVNGVSVDNLTMEALLKSLRGEQGETVSLALKRGDELIQVTLQRELIAVDEGRAQLSYDKVGNGVIAKIKLDSFYKGANGVTSENDVRRAIKEAKEQGHLEGVILDLRDNSGGFLTQAVKVAGLFVSNGVIVVSKYSEGDSKLYRDVDGQKIFDGPLIILTSKATASAAEIVAQALQDWGVAVVVGDEKTYGKGSIQSQTVTGGDDALFFKVTVGHYYTVSGKTPEVQGVKADIVVPSYYSVLDIGEEYVGQGHVQDTMHPFYEDSLSDVEGNLKPWYLRYYLPTLQKQNKFWKSHLSQLKVNSHDRLAKNKNYQEFLIFLENPNKSLNEYDWGHVDLQMEEATNIMKDMILLSKKASRYHPDLVMQKSLKH